MLQELLWELVRDMRLVESNSQEQWAISAVMALNMSENEHRMSHVNLKVNVVSKTLKPDCCLCGLDVRKTGARHGGHVDWAEDIRVKATGVLDIRTNWSILEFLFTRL